MITSISGQGKALQILSNTIRSNKIANGYIFYGPKGVGKFTVALEFVMAINCKSTNKPCYKCDTCKKIKNFNHPDLIYIFPMPNLGIAIDGNIKKQEYLKEISLYKKNRIETPYKEFYFSSNTSIRLDAIHMIQHMTNISKNEATKKVVLIEDCDQMNLSAANAFLKTLEEPTDDVVIIMVTSNIKRCLPTIVSRCQRIPFYSLSESIIKNQLIKRYGVENLKARTIAKLSSGNMERAINNISIKHSQPKEFTQKLLENAIEKNDFQFLQLIAKSPIRKEPDWLGDVLNYLLIWFFDITVFYVNRDSLINSDQTQLIEKIIKRAPKLYRDSNEIISQIEKIKILLKNNNINPVLAINSVYSKISKLVD